MLRQRILVVAVLLPVGLVALWWGNWALWFLGEVMLLLAAWEYLGLWREQSIFSPPVPVLAGVAALSSVLYWQGPIPAVWAVLGLWTMVLMTWHIVRYERFGTAEATGFAVGWTGAAYIAVFGGHLLALRQLPYGWFWILLVLLSVWAADSLAYFVGRGWGRHPLSTRISPKKTWEGYFGGLLGGPLAAGLWMVLARGPGWLPPHVTMGQCMLLGLLLAAITPLGDLGQSLFKRQAGVKDSGRLLPGHGGVFDRIDSWLWAGMLGYWFIRLWMG